MALLRATALDRAVRAEEKAAKREKHLIDPENIERLAERILFHLFLFGCCLLAVAVLFLPADLKQQQLLQSHS